MPGDVALDELISERAEDFAHKLRERARTATKEEEIRIEAERQLAFIEEAAGVTLEGRHEFTVARGRVDSVYDRVLIEYKNPSNNRDRIGPHLRSPGTKAVVRQIKSRFAAMQEEYNQPLNALLGVGLDGNYLIFVRFRDGAWDVQDPVPVTKSTSERFLWALFNIGRRGKPFAPDYLAEDFGAGAEIARRGIRALYDAILATREPKAETLFAEWKLLFSEVCGYDVETPTAKLKRLAESYSIPLTGLKPAALLFALHTYYALFMKLLASELVAFSHKLPGPLRKILQAHSTARLKAEVIDLEAGSLFRHFNITNFLEGDLFSWYVATWDDSIVKLVRDMAERLDNYNPGTLSEDPGKSRDLLKQLYQRLFPRSVRHDLGEFYTPDWLADYVLDEIGYDGNPEDRILDPACGSGTFLVMAINRIRSRFDEKRTETAMTDGELGEAITRNVVGFDLNPLAVMAARTNYLIAIRDLIGPMGRIEIPVYLCDSIIRPSEHADLFAGEVGLTLELRTAVGKFILPTEISQSARIVARYTEELQFCVANKYSAKDFLQRCKDEELPVEQDEVHSNLFEQVLGLDKAGKNGVWARIIKNSFAPLFAGKFNFVVGNPPWVNWEHLPPEYRTETASVWQHYRLIGFGPTGRRQSSDRSKTDVAILMFYVCADSYLQARGRLGFVITQTVFQSELGGRSFRRFALPDGTGLMCKRVDDMIALAPFEDAANRTATIVVQKGGRVSYPISYRMWSKRRRGRISEVASLEAVKAITTRHAWIAVPVRESDPLSSWLVGPKAGVMVARRFVGPSYYEDRAREGANTRGANGIFCVDIEDRAGDQVVVRNRPDLGRGRTQQVTAQVEQTHVYPLVRGRDVRRWAATPSLHIVLAHDRGAPTDPIPEAKLRREARFTYAFLRNFEGELRARRRFRNFDPSSGAFYGLYNVGDYTFAEHRVVWREQATDFICAAIGPSEDVGDGAKPRLVNHKLMQVPASSRNEALYLAGMLNSSLARYIVLSYTVSTQISTHVLENIPIPEFSPSNPRHMALASLAERAGHAAQSEPAGLSAIEESADTVAAEVFGLREDELAAIRTSLVEVISARRIAGAQDVAADD